MRPGFPIDCGHPERGGRLPLVTPTSLSDTITRQVTEILNASPQDDTQLLVPTYLGNDQRRYYGQGTPEDLTLHHRFYLGSGISIVGGTSYTWSGAGWTGQPTLLRDRGRLYLVIGAYDHQLRKIDLETQEEVWTYRFDDILKGTATIYIDETASEENQIVILQGSRLGVTNSLASAFVPSFRAVSFRTGQELWRMNIRRTDSYSRDTDSSPLYLGNHTIFNPGENSIGYFINSRVEERRPYQGFFVPEIYKELQLYEAEDVPLYQGNLVAESSPARWGDRLYLASGGGDAFTESTFPARRLSGDFAPGETSTEPSASPKTVNSSVPSIANASPVTEGPINSTPANPIPTVWTGFSPPETSVLPNGREELPGLWPSTTSIGPPTPPPYLPPTPSTVISTLAVKPKSRATKCRGPSSKTNMTPP